MGYNAAFVILGVFVLFLSPHLLVCLLGKDGLYESEKKNVENYEMCLNAYFLSGSNSLVLSSSFNAVC
jgi:hypothetical protein